MVQKQKILGQKSNYIVSSKKVIMRNSYQNYDYYAVETTKPKKVRLTKKSI